MPHVTPTPPWFAGLLSLALLTTTACAAPSDDESTSGADAVSASTGYDSVVRDGRKFDTNKLVSATQSASTHLVAYVPGGKEDKLLAKLVSLKRWTEIRDENGKHPFSDSVVRSDERSGATQTVKARLTIQKLLSVDLAAVAVADPSSRATITNTANVGHLLAGGTVIEVGKLVLDVKFIPHHQGVIIDATMRVKARKFEDEAFGFTETVGPLVDWLQAEN